MTELPKGPRKATDLEVKWTEYGESFGPPLTFRFIGPACESMLALWPWDIRWVLDEIDALEEGLRDVDALCRPRPPRKPAHPGGLTCIEWFKGADAEGNPAPRLAL